MKAFIRVCSCISIEFYDKIAKDLLSDYTVHTTNLILPAYIRYHITPVRIE